MSQAIDGRKIVGSVTFGLLALWAVGGSLLVAKTGASPKTDKTTVMVKSNDCDTAECPAESCEVTAEAKAISCDTTDCPTSPECP